MKHAVRRAAVCALLVAAGCVEDPAPAATFTLTPRTLPDLEVATPLSIDLVFAREAIWLYARDPGREPACDDVIFPDVGVCASWMDVPCEHVEGPSLAPCLRTAELVVMDTGERIPFDPHGGLSAIEPWTFDPYTAPLSLHLEGCSLSTDVTLPRPLALPPAVTAIEQNDDVTVVTLDETVGVVRSDSSGRDGTLCGEPPTDEVRMVPRAGYARTFATVAPLGTLDSAFGPVRVSQRFEGVREVAEIARDRAEPVPVKLNEERFFHFGPLGSFVIQPDGAVDLEFSIGSPDSEPLVTRVTLGLIEHVIERTYPDGHVMRAVRPSRVRGGGIGHFEAFSVYWRERVRFVDVSGATPAEEQLIWLEFNPGVAVIPSE